MIYLKNINTGVVSKFSEGTIKALRGIPKGYVEVEAPKMNIQKLPPKPMIPTLEEAQVEFEKNLKAIAATKQEVPKEEVLDEIFPEVLDTSGRDKMMEELKAAGIRVSPNIGIEKLTERYENFIAKNG